MFNEFDEKINSALSIFNEQLKKLEFPTDCAVYINLNESLLSIDLPENCNKSGVYLFEMKLPTMAAFGERTNTKINRLIEAWTHTSVRKMWSPSIRQTRLNAHKTGSNGSYQFKEDWIPFYIGKSRNIAKRVNEHIFQDRNKTSFAMKLKARVNLYGNDFRISYIPIEVKNYDMIVPHVERRMREKYNPIAGKQ